MNNKKVSVSPQNFLDSVDRGIGPRTEKSLQDLSDKFYFQFKRRFGDLLIDIMPKKEIYKKKGLLNTPHLYKTAFSDKVFYSTTRKEINKHIVFLLDLSSSMGSTTYSQTSMAIQNMLVHAFARCFMDTPLHNTCTVEVFGKLGSCAHPPTLAKIGTFGKQTNRRKKEKYLGYLKRVSSSLAVFSERPHQGNLTPEHLLFPAVEKYIDTHRYGRDSIIINLTDGGPYGVFFKNSRVNDPNPFYLSSDISLGPSWSKLARNCEAHTLFILDDGDNSYFPELKKLYPKNAYIATTEKLPQKLISILKNAMLHI